MKKKLFIFSNESIYINNDKFFCDNIDLKSTPEGLSKYFDVNLFARKSFKKRSHEVKLKKIKIFTNIFSYITEVISSSKNKDSKYFVISITPYTFIISLLLRILGKKPLIYLRSDGYGEYKAILGLFGKFVYHLMFNISSLVSNFVSCRDYILRGKKGVLVKPSQLDTSWFKKTKSIEIKKFKLLYVGRIRKEKGIFSLVDILKNKRDISLTIVGAEHNTTSKIDFKNISTHINESNKSKLIKFYDDHNIFILPSFTEGYPMVVLESLARRRPIVIFEDIKHIITNQKGIFVSKRNFVSLFGTLNYIKKNYNKIQKELRKNELPTKSQFIENLSKLISNTS